MNELSEITAKIKSGETLTLEKKTYAIAPEDSFYLTGLHFSNTAKREENPQGERFCGIFLENKENVVIDGNGSTVLIHGIMTPFIFLNCRNIVMKNFTFDHFRPTMSEMEVIECVRGRALVRIGEEFRCEIRHNNLFWLSEDDSRGRLYWENRYKGPDIRSCMLNPANGIIEEIPQSAGDRWHGMPDIGRIEERGNGLYEITFRDSEVYFAPGTVIQTRNIIREQTGGAILESSGVTLENLRIMSMNGFGILAQNSSDITYLSLDCTPKQGRTIVSDADFFHYSGCSGRLTVRGCRAKGAHDDIINVHGTHLKITGLDKDKGTVTVRYSHPESRGFNPYVAGDRIEFVCGNTLLPYFDTVVTGVTQLSDTDFAVSAESLPESVCGDNDVIENTTRTASLLVEDCVFETIPSRGILCTTRKDVLIRNTVFRNMGMPALLIADDANFWFESGRSGLVRFEDNTVINCGARECASGCDVIRYEPVIMDSSSLTPVHKKLVVRGNSFTNTNSDEYTFNLCSLESAEIENNRSNVELKIKTDGRGSKPVAADNTVCG